MNALKSPAGIVVMAIVALLLGMGLAALIGPRHVTDLSGRDDVSSINTAKQDLATDSSQHIEPPVFFYVATARGVDLGVVSAEIQMAGNAGVHHHVLTIALPWGRGWDSIDRIIEMAYRADKRGRFYLDIDLNPPTSWLIENKLETSTEINHGVSFPSVGSRLWIRDIKRELDLLIEHLIANEKWNAIDGCILSALQSGQWAPSGGYDESTPNIEAFRNWLHERYGTDEEFRTAWNSPNTDIDDAEVPDSPGASETVEVFLDGSKDRQRIDYRLYLSDQIVSVINEVVSHLKAATNKPFTILVPYGNGLTTLYPEFAQFGLAKLMRGEADGFIVNISPTDRGIGGAGGYTAAVDSARLHGKRCYLLDDTRTGIGLREGSNEVRRPVGLRRQDLLNVYRRNFAAAVVKGLGIMWADVNGTGNLHDNELWTGLGTLKDLYTEIINAPHPARDPLDRLGITVVVDEQSRAYEVGNESIANSLYGEITNLVLQTGAKASFVLFDDVVEGRTPPASCYLFLNTVEISVDEMKKLHALLDETDALAIWMYASGYIRDTSSAEHISELTRVHVSSFKEKHPTASVFAFDGNWIAEGQTLAMPESWRPQFFVDDEEMDPIAYYAETEWPSIAIKFLEEGWTSVYVGMPRLTAGLLKEILDIADVPIVTRRSSASLTDTFNMNDTLMYIHASGSGTRIFDFEDTYDVLNLFDKTIGWPQKRSLTISMEAGETQLFQILPSYESVGQ